MRMPPFIRTPFEKLGIVLTYRGSVLPIWRFLSVFDISGRVVAPKHENDDPIIRDAKRVGKNGTVWRQPTTIEYDNAIHSVVAAPWHAIGAGILLFCVCYHATTDAGQAKRYWGIHVIAYDTKTDAFTPLGSFAGVGYNDVRPGIVPNRLKHGSPHTEE